MSPSSSSQAAGIYFGRDAVACVLLQTDADGRTQVSSKTAALARPLFKGAPESQSEALLEKALCDCATELRGRHIPVHLVVPDAALNVAAFDLDQVPASPAALERLVEFRLAKELGASNGTCVSQLLGRSDGRSLLLGASMDKSWLATLLAACDGASIVPWSLTAMAASVFNAFHDSIRGTSGALIATSPDAWALWVWDAAGLARPLRSQWRPGTHDEREIAAEVERALIAYTDGDSSRAIELLHVWSPGASDTLCDLLDQRVQQPCSRRVWPETMIVPDSCESSAALAACVMAAST